MEIDPLKQQTLMYLHKDSIKTPTTKSIWTGDNIGPAYLFLDLYVVQLNFGMRVRLHGAFPNVRSFRHLLRIWSNELFPSIEARLIQLWSILQVQQTPTTDRFG